MRIDLIWLDEAGAAAPDWPLGAVTTSAADPWSLANAPIDGAPDFYLFWDASLGAPDSEAMARIAGTAGDVWHCGLRQGMRGLPQLINYVDPVWRFNRDPDDDQPATSWRLSLRACLARAETLRSLGGVDPHFESLAGASLELGHRWITRGAMMRYVPQLIPAAARERAQETLSPADEMRFIHLRYGRMWAGWAAWRRVRKGESPADTWRVFRREQAPGIKGATPHLYDGEVLPAPPACGCPTVTVLIPTLDRYPHLFNLLDQLREQTVRPAEIIVVDQTEWDHRQEDWPEQFQDLPLRVIWRDHAGQCSSRNAGLQAATGDAILFLDDDDEIEPDLIERHLAYLMHYWVDASCGVAEEAGAGALPVEFTYARDSDVFPTNNSLLRREALCDSGLFDLAYERGERADGDLGMRLYLAGKTLRLNPSASVYHLHAPRGGLRQHEARVTTRSASKASLRQRHLLAPTQGYLWSRYFTPGQVHEALLIRTVSTVRGGPGGLGSAVRALAMIALLPLTWKENSDRLRQGQEMLYEHPTIPELNSVGLLEESERV